MKQTVKVPGKLILSVVAACLVSFCGLLTETAVNIAFPSIMETFGVTTKTVQWLTTGNLLVVAMVTPLSAFLQRRFRLRQLFVFGTACFLGGTVVALLSPNFGVLLLARLLQGVGTGVGVPIAFCIILEQIPFQKVGTYMGYGALVSAAAPALGPTYGGIVNQMLGWRAIFLLLLPVLVLTMILGVCTIAEQREPEKVPVDGPGIAWIMLAFLCLVYGFANLGSFGEAPLVEVLVFVVGVLALVLFARHCGRCAHPLLDVGIFRNVPFTCHLTAFFLINAIMLGTSFLLPNYLQVALLCPSMLAGFLLLPGAGLNAVMGPFSGAALDQIGPRLPVLTGTGLMTVGVLLLALFGQRLSVGMVVGFYILFGVGCGMAFGNTMTVGNLRLPVEQKAYGNTAFNTLMQFAGAVGTSVCAALVAAAQNRAGDLPYEAKTALGTAHGFLFLLVLAAVSFCLQVVGFRHHRKNRAEG